MVTAREKELLKEIKELKVVKRKKTFGGQIKRLGEGVPIQQPIQQMPIQEQRQQRRRGTGITNFFSHKSDKEVFGDEGLTFFDSQKANRGRTSTAEFFGI